MADLPPLKDVIARFGLQARKSLGQNFLFDINLTRRIARAAGDLERGTIVEIGPGPGGLTRALLIEGAARVIAVERDTRAIGALRDLAEAFPGRLEILEADALEVDAARLGEAPRKIVANLPYNVATPLLISWLREATAFTSLTLLFQKEVAERLCAKPRDSAYGRLSILAQWLCETKKLFDIDRRAFTPAPKVTSTLVGFQPRPKPLAPADFAILERVTQAAFGQRRKMLRQSLKPLGDAAALLEATGIDPTRRAEELSVEEFCALARACEAEPAPIPRRADG